LTLHTARDIAVRSVRGSGLSARPGFGQLLLLGVAVLSGVAALAVASISEAEAGVFGAQVLFPAAVSGIALAGYVGVSRAALRARVSAHDAERFSALVQSSSDVVAVVSAAGSMLYISPSVTAIFGHLPEDLSGGEAVNLVHPEDRGAFRNEFRQVVATPGASEIVECRLSHSDGSWRHVEMRLTNLLHVRAVHGIVLNTRDVTERRLLEEELRHQAFHDPLTGLGNRTLLTARIEQALAAARRDGTSVALLCCEIDQRRRITDSLGSNAESNAVRVVAERLRGSVRTGDTVARIGGQEFGILLEHLDNPSSAFPAIQRIMAARISDSTSTRRSAVACIDGSNRA
jgi:diguanylate cyclase (GGDEF)-like protein/PAS domain S-box-containing protein